MDSDLPTLDRNAYLAGQADELLISTRNRDPLRVVQVLRHVFAEAGNSAGTWLANWYFDKVTAGETEPELHAMVKECVAELRAIYGSR